MFPKIKTDIPFFLRETTEEVPTVLYYIKEKLIYLTLLKGAVEQMSSRTKKHGLQTQDEKLAQIPATESSGPH